MTDTLDVAVIIPTIGRPELDRALTSVLEQTVAPHEIIVVNNGRHELDAPAGVTILRIPPMSGPSAARNHGAVAATSTWVAFLDDDDAYTPDFVEHMWAHRDPKRILYARQEFINDNGNVWKSKRVSDADDLLERLYIHSNPGCGGNNLMLTRDAFLELGGFPEDMRAVEDRAFAIKALRAGLGVAHVEDAAVLCYEPDGYRAKTDSTMIRACLRVMRDNWSDMTWKTRARSIRRLLQRYRRRHVG